MVQGLKENLKDIDLSKEDNSDVEVVVTKRQPRNVSTHTSPNFKFVPDTESMIGDILKSEFPAQPDMSPEVVDACKKPSILMHLTKTCPKMMHIPTKKPQADKQLQVRILSSPL